MKKNSGISTLQVWRYLAGLLPALLFPAVATALTVTATPPKANIVPEMNNSVPIFYRALQASSPAVPGTTPFSATSPTGRFETLDGVPLGTYNRSQTISLVNNQGSATETVIVPAEVVSAALNRGRNRLFFRRTFTPSIRTLFPVDLEVELQIVPASAGQFSLVGMTLAFNSPPGRHSSRPASGGRITVSRNTQTLSAVANLTYNGGGTLRGKWKIDDQILGYVNRYLPAGQREIALKSPPTLVFPTYATGLHRVEFEVLEPLTGFDEPVIFYYVREEPPGPPLGSLKLLTPTDRTQVPLAAEALPVFSWQPVREGVIYHLQLYGLEQGSNPRELSDFSGSKPLLAAMTRESTYTLSVFDFDRIVPGMPYVWQVQAYEGRTGVAASRYQRVVFTRTAPGNPADRENTPQNPQTPDSPPDRDGSAH